MTEVARESSRTSDVPEGQGRADVYEDAAQEAARLARAHIPECIDAVAGILRKPMRHARTVMDAAKWLVDVASAHKPPPPAEAKEDGRVVLLDVKRAAAVLAARLKAERD